MSMQSNFKSRRAWRRPATPRAMWRGEPLTDANRHEFHRWVRAEIDKGKSDEEIVVSIDRVSSSAKSSDEDAAVVSTEALTILWIVFAGLVALAVVITYGAAAGAWTGVIAAGLTLGIALTVRLRRLP